MRIALSMSTVSQNGNSDVQDGISHNWIKWAGDNGITPYLVPNDISDLHEYIDSLSINLIVLTGSELSDDKRRSTTERKLVEMSIKKRIPLLGTGRGMQFLNKYFGGSLEFTPNKSNGRREVIFTTPWQKLYKDNTEVNSNYAYSMVETGLGKGFKIAAINPDGYVEAITHNEYPITGIMWNPEINQDNPGDLALIKSINNSPH